MIALVMYKDRYYIAEKQIELTSYGNRNMFQTEWRLHNGDYVFSYDIKIEEPLMVEGLEEAIKLYPELLV